MLIAALIFFLTVFEHVVPLVCPCYRLTGFNEESKILLLVLYLRAVLIPSSIFYNFFLMKSDPGVNDCKSSAYINISSTSVIEFQPRQGYIMSL